MLIKDEGLQRNHWPLGVVTEAIPDDDGLVRRIKVKVGVRGTAPVNILERSVHTLVCFLNRSNSIKCSV